MAFSNHDVKPDTPINNFATLNPLNYYYSSASNPTVSEGNLKFATTGGTYRIGSTLAVTSGKWYFEAYRNDATAVGNEIAIGVVDSSKQLGTGQYGGAQTNAGANANEWALTDRAFACNNTDYINTGLSSNSINQGKIVQVLIDMNLRSISWGVNNVWYYNAFTNLSDSVSPVVYTGTGTVTSNFGQDPTFNGLKTPTKVYTDSNGQGRFYYEPPEGALALCSRNIDTPKNVPTTYIVDETNAKMLTYNGNTEISTFSPYAADGYSLHGIATTGLSFGSVSDFKYLHDNTDQSYSISCWVYRTAGDVAQTLVDTCNFSSLGYGVSFSIEANNKVFFQINKGSGGNAVASTGSNETLPLNKWTHISVLHNGTITSGDNVVSMYINGVEVTYSTRTYNHTNSSNNSSTSLHVGIRSGATLGFTGYIADLAIMKNVTSSNSVAQSSKITSSTHADIDFLLSVDSIGFKDSSSSPKTVTTVGAPSIEAWSPYTSIDKQTGFELPSTTNGGSFSFDGNSQQLKFATSADFEFTGDATVEMWVYLNSAATGITPLYGYSATDNTDYFALIILSNGKLQWSQKNVGSGEESAASIIHGQWYHIALVKDGNTLKVYNNGVERISSSYTASFPTGHELRIGSWTGATGWGSNTDLNGYIADYRVVKGTAVYTGNFTPPSGKLTATGGTYPSGANISAITSGETKLLLQPFQPKSSVNSSVFNITDSYNKGEANTVIINDGDTKVVDFSPYKGGSHGSFAFDGGSDAGFLLPSSGANLDLGAGQFTFEAWIYFRDATANKAVIDKLSTGFEIYLRGSSYTDYSVFDRTGGGTLFSSGSAAAGDTNKWTHIALSRNSSNEVRLYINGVSVGSATSTASFNFQGGRIGSNHNKGAEHFNGFMTDIRMIKGQAIYSGTNSFTPPAFPLRTDKYSTDGSDPSGGSNITGNIAFLFQPGKVADTDNEAAKDPDAFFKCVAYTGNTDSVRDISVGFQPDFVWVKQRDITQTHALQDSVRGPSKMLDSSDQTVEYTATTYGQLTHFEPDGFKVTYGSNGTYDYYNQDTKLYIAWCWKAGGVPSADGKIIKDGTESNISDLVTSTGASLTPTRISANTKAGFSIITYTSNQNSSSGSTDTLPHGLTFAPEIIIIKQLNNNLDWMVWHKSLSTNYNLNLNTTSKEFSVSYGGIRTPNASTIDLGGSLAINSSWTNTPQLYVCYAWHSVPGYSAFGAYTGNNNAEGPFVYTGFKPALVILKVYNYATTTYTSWGLYDNTRPSGTHNPVHSPLWANRSDVEGNRGNGGGGGNSIFVDFLSNGFKIRSNHTEINSDLDGIIYSAFAELPSSFARGR